MAAFSGGQADFFQPQAFGGNAYQRRPNEVAQTASFGGGDWAGDDDYSNEPPLLEGTAHSLGRALCTRAPARSQ